MINASIVFTCLSTDVWCADKGIFVLSYLFVVFIWGVGGECKTYRIWNLGFVCLGRRGTDDNLYNFFVCLAGVLVFYQTLPFTSTPPLISIPLFQHWSENDIISNNTETMEFVGQKGNNQWHFYSPLTTVIRSRTRAWTIEVRGEDKGWGDRGYNPARAVLLELAWCHTIEDWCQC